MSTKNLALSRVLRRCSVGRAAVNGRCSRWGGRLEQCSCDIDDEEFCGMMLVSFFVYCQDLFIGEDVIKQA